MTQSQTETFQPSVKVIKHSIIEIENNKQRELFTFSGTMHRYVLSEFNTHRNFSRNSASSRAVPTLKMIELAKTARVEPISWGENRPGMSASEELDGDDRARALNAWDYARSCAVESAYMLEQLNVHKQVINRLLEPFLPHTVVFTCDRKGLDAFLSLRDHPAAQPEIAAFARKLSQVAKDSIPQVLQPGEVHLPFVDEIYNWEDLFNLQAITDSTGKYTDDEFMYSPQIYKSVSTCARYSYLKHEDHQTEESNERLFWKLYQMRHMSPFEHVAVALPLEDRAAKSIRKQILGVFSAPRQNYSSKFLQLRKVIELDDIPVHIRDRVY